MTTVAFLYAKSIRGAGGPRFRTRHARRRRLPGLLAIGALSAGLLLAAPPPTAAAHNDLIAATPAAETRQYRPPAQLVLQFSEDVNPKFATITLAVDGADPVALPDRVDGATVTATPPDAAAAGAWTVAYRIVSADGHPVTGRLTFTVAASAAAPTTSAAAPTPTASASPRSSASPTPTSTPTTTTAPVTDQHAGARWWRWLVVGLVALTLVGGPVAAASRGLGVRTDPAPADDSPRDDNAETGPGLDSPAADEPVPGAPTADGDPGPSSAETGNPTDARPGDGPLHAGPAAPPDHGR